MRFNIAGQTVGAQMLSASDHSAFTGAVTVYITLNGGTQAIGSVGSGVCTHEGNGYHTYAPSQAETNGAHIAFTFIGTGAIPFTEKIYTTNLATSAELAADFLTAANADPIAANTKEVNDISIDGAGSTSDPWGPV